MNLIGIAVTNASLTPFFTLREVFRGTGDDRLEELDPADLGVLGEVARWTVDYLCQSHPELGRTGDVCPYTEVSMREDLLLAAVCHVYDADPRPEMGNAMMQTMADFESRPPKVGNRAGLKAMLVLFPSIEGVWVDDVQQQLSLTFARRGLMIGEFHAECQKPGLHNLAFRPLRSPVPLLAVRSMMLTDLAFLKTSDEKLDCYLRRFQDAALKQISAYLRSPFDEVEEDVLYRLESALYGLR